MRALVTGVAGFIGSTLTDALLARGDQVLGVDCFTTYYDRAAKEANISGARLSERFELLEVDLRTCEIEALLDGIDVVFHQAAQPGVRFAPGDLRLPPAMDERWRRFGRAPGRSGSGGVKFRPTSDSLAGRPAKLHPLS